MLPPTLAPCDKGRATPSVNMIGSSNLRLQPDERSDISRPRDIQPEARSQRKAALLQQHVDHASHHDGQPDQREPEIQGAAAHAGGIAQLLRSDIVLADRPPTCGTGFLPAGLGGYCRKLDSTRLAAVGQQDLG